MSRVSLKFYKELINEISGSGIAALIDFGSSSLHLVNGAFQREAEQSDWNLKENTKKCLATFSR